MDPLKSATVPDAKEFFALELKTAIENQNARIQPNSFEYLVNLLLRFMESDVFFKKNEDGKLEHNILAELYADFLSGDSQQKCLSLRRLGDVCLLITGFFSDSLKRKLVDMDYYWGMGGSAYWCLSHLQWTEISQELYKELAVKFKIFSSLLAEISDRSGIHSNSDLLCIYERWCLTGSERLRALLQEHGIHAPVPVEQRTKH